jgi:hypothetical protein
MNPKKKTLALEKSKSTERHTERHRERERERGGGGLNGKLQMQLHPPA